MRQSTFLCRTSRQAPADVELPGLQQAMRAGALRASGAGLYTWLPLGQRILARLSNKARAAVEALGAQPISLPALQPADRDAPDQFKVQDRAGRRYALDHGEPASLLRALQNDLESYRRLPLAVYRLAALFRDEERPRGLLRAREFAALSAVSLHAGAADLEAFYPRMRQALADVLRVCELDVWEVSTRRGHEFLLPYPAGDGVLFACTRCNYRAVSDEARFVKLAPQVLSLSSAPGALQEAATPNCRTIADVAAFLQAPVTQTLKTMMYANEQGRVVFAVIRGDLDVNFAKLEHAAGLALAPGSVLAPATDEQIRAAGAVPGYASPVGLSGAIVIADDSIQSAEGMIAGANKEGYHLTGVSVPRDLTPTVVADIAQAQPGSACPECRGKLEAVNVVELGGCAQWGTELCQDLGITFLDADRQERPPAVGGYGLGLSRIVAAVIETHYDAHGLIWPAAIAPFDAHLILLGKEPREQAETLYTQLQQAGVSVLYDDRDESPGVKFADADLIGIPTRITVSKRNLDKGCVEVKARASSEARLVPLENIPNLFKEDKT